MNKEQTYKQEDGLILKNGRMMTNKQIVKELLINETRGLILNHIESLSMLNNKLTKKHKGYFNGEEQKNDK